MMNERQAAPVHIHHSAFIIHHFFHHASSLICASGTIVRISKMEMTGRKRMKRNIRKKKKPMVPKNMVKSKMVGAYMPQEEGRKSRCRLIGMMMKRSSHMPTLTN